MSNETLFYVCGIALAVSAVLISIVGLKAKDFPGKAFPVVILWFAILVGGATTFAVLHAKDEQEAKAAELEQAGEKFEAVGADNAAEGEAPAADEEEPVGETGGEAQPEKAQPEGETAQGPGGTLQLAADPSAIAFDKTSLSSKPGRVTIDFDNPAPLEHDVAIEADGKEIAKSELITEGKASVSAELAPGTYTFYCTVPGHREAGMEGTLTVK
ncbi:MAG TPA: plastocyanin/azurin family copper-binding protein [Solirubrobacterales bacterium]|jgi:plastocyanin|nr:plastocyanin/azurin family copper-binding protein [Solirubrobacterales bacterium]